MPDLPTRELGRTGLNVTTMGYGAMELRGAAGGRGREIAPDDVGRILNAVLDSGINFIDTSPDYGESEEQIGKHISSRRSEYFLASKCGCLVAVEPTEGGPRHVYTRENIVAAVERSLTRMKTDYLDLVQFHGSPSRAELEEHDAIATLEDLKAQGKVRFIGSSSTLPNLEEHIAMGVFDEFQIPYSALQRQHEDVIARAAEAGAGIVIRGGAARGAPSADKQWAVRLIGAGDGSAADLWQRARIDELIEGQMDRMEFTMRFTLTHPHLHTTIVGTVNPDHLAENLAAVAQGPLPDDLYEEAKRRLAEAGSAPE